MQHAAHDIRTNGFCRFPLPGVSARELQSFFYNHSAFFGQGEAEKLAEQGESWRYYREKSAIRSEFLEVAAARTAGGKALDALLRSIQPLRSALEACATKVLRDVATDLGFCPNQLLRVAKPSTAVMRLCSYANHTSDQATAFAEHTDCTLISIGICVVHEPLSEKEDGLEVRALDGGWHFAESGAKGIEVVVFAGDMLQVVSQQRYLAAIHRVTILPGAARLSAPLLVRGDMSCSIPRSLCTLVNSNSCLHKLLMASETAQREEQQRGGGTQWRGAKQAAEEKNYEECGIVLSDFRHSLLEPSVMCTEIFEPIFLRSREHQQPALVPALVLQAAPVVPPYQPRELLGWAYSSSKKDEKWWTASDEPRLRSGLVLAPQAELSCLTYGEITVGGVEMMLGLVAEQPCCSNGMPEVLYDLGSGFGRLIMQAALRTVFQCGAGTTWRQRLRLVKVGGIELLEERHLVACTAMSAVVRQYLQAHAQLRLNGGSSSSPPKLQAVRMADAATSMTKSKVHIELTLADILLADFTDATVVYFSSLCFPEDVLRQASRKLDSLCMLHSIVSLRMLPLRTFALQDCHALPMSWGSSGAMAYFYCRIEFFPLYWPHPLLTTAAPTACNAMDCTSLVVYGGGGR
jgi:isopenicillin N synthase-like dioxygenase